MDEEKNIVKKGGKGNGEKNREIKHEENKGWIKTEIKDERKKKDVHRGRK